MKPPQWELYDLQNDPFERENLAEKPEFSSHFERLKASLAKWQNETDDPLATEQGLAAMTAQIEQMEAQQKAAAELKNK